MFDLTRPALHSQVKMCTHFTYYREIEAGEHLEFGALGSVIIERNSSRFVTLLIISLLPQSSWSSQKVGMTGLERRKTTMKD